MKFTIITITHNEEKKIADTINSVVIQNHKNFEYLIIDSNSSDKTVSIAKKLAEESNCDMKVFSETDFGVYNAMNRGIVRASGDYIIFMNAGDSFWNSSVLFDIEKQINRYGNAIYFGKTYLLKNGKCKGVKDLLKSYRSVYDALMRGDMPTHQSIAAPLYLLKKYYFNEEYKIRADYDWLLKCYKDKVQFINLGFPVCKYDRSGISSKTKYKKLQKEETKMIRRRNYPIMARIYELLEQLQ